MASATTASSNNDSECVLCPSNHNRNRPSFCQCKHCSIPLCLDCMKEHHEELLQDVAQMSHQYNELQEVLQTKQMMIVDETKKSIENVNRYFDGYIGELRDIQQKITVNMEKSKQDAQDYMLKINSDLRTIGSEIQGLTKESVVQMTKMNNLSAELKKIEQQLNTYQATRTENLIETKPDFSIKFVCSSNEIEKHHSTDMEMNEICQTDSQEPSSKTNTLNIFDQPSGMQKSPISQSNTLNMFGQCSFVPKFPISQSNTLNMFGQPFGAQKYPTSQPNTLSIFGQSSSVPKFPISQPGKMNAVEDSSMSDDDADTEDSLIETSYKVDRMASDGKNILYTTYNDKRSDRIAYCLIDDDDDDDDDDNEDDNDDECRDWNRPRIKQMIWWNSIRKFVCATDDGIYTVDYTNKKFKITCVIREKWSFIRVAANNTHLYIRIKSIENDFNGIEVYSIQFAEIRTIDFNSDGIGSFVDNNGRFCVTENLIVSIYTSVQNNREVSQVVFCDMNMKKLNSVLLGECNGDTEIRTDGNDRFFVTTGGRIFYIIVFQGETKTMNLQHNGKWIAVLDDRRVAISNGRSDIELITY